MASAVELHKKVSHSPTSSPIHQQGITVAPPEFTSICGVRDYYNVWKFAEPGFVQRLPLFSSEPVSWKDSRGNLHLLDNVFLRTVVDRVQASSTHSPMGGGEPIVVPVNEHKRHEASSAKRVRTNNTAKGKHAKAHNHAQTHTHTHSRRVARNAALKLPMNWFCNPLAVLYVLRCENYDQYKNEHSPRIRRFFATLDPPKAPKAQPGGPQLVSPADCLILYLPLGSRGQHAKTGKSDKIYQRVFERLRSDFQKAACVKLELFSRAADPAEQWQELFAKLEKIVRRSFERRCALYEAELLRRHANRALPGWNFCRICVCARSATM